MKMVNNSQRRSFRLPVFWINSDDFVNIFKKAVQNGDEFTVEVNNGGGQRIILESLAELERDAHYLTKEFSLRFGTIQLDLDGYSTSISFDAEDEAKALTILENLKIHEPFVFRLLNRKLFLAGVLIPTGLLWYVSEDATINEIGIIAIALFLLMMPVAIFISQDLLVPKILHVNEKSFWSRNKDKIILSSATFLLGLLSSHFPNVLENLRALLK
ncbi:hypothetical protein [Pseudotabrizicola sp.]|uniref:hypothetical protein n=1 Tax=Pseudotabrizicola sp. TaxID=2939647 RepID=UPI002723AC9E|nr:hypothetical protein [Pseudotabrizicola sp.]MDO8884216.1 hypothetical protein [Pseudotabrizicola sp.]